MTLSNDTVLKTLQTQFVCGFRNITGEPGSGKSGKHDADEAAVFTTNGAGPHNVQMFFLAPDGTVLHVLPGYWDPRDLMFEMQFASQIYKLYNDKSLSPQRKNALFAQANLAHVRQHPQDMRERSHLQGFDAKEERQKSNSDFTFKPGDYRPSYQPRKKQLVGLKTTDQVMHERMAQRPFPPYENFDWAEFGDYGKQRYDKRENQRAMGLKK